jgi:hypothetical protein
MPVPRDGGYFTLIQQFQGNTFMLAFLDDFKKNPAMADPYLTVTCYEDLAADKGLVLARGDKSELLTMEVPLPLLVCRQSAALSFWISSLLANWITICSHFRCRCLYFVHQESEQLTSMALQVYLSDTNFEFVKTFNHAPDEFDFSAWLSICNGKSSSQ